MNPNPGEIPVESGPAAPALKPLRAKKWGPARTKPLNRAWLLFFAALTMIVFEGAFRKWVFPHPGTMRYLLYFSKDILFASILLFPVRFRSPPALKVFEHYLWPGVILIGAGALLSCTQGFNPVGAVLTLRAAIVLPIIAWLAVSRLRGLPLSWVLWLLAALTFFNFGLGVEQNRLPAGHFLNRYAEDTVEVAEVASGVRASGTFAYITGLTIISTVGVWAGLALLSLAKKEWQRLGGLVTLACGFGCGMASVSRSPIVVGVALMAGWLFYLRGKLSVLTNSLMVGALCLLLAYVLALTRIFVDLGNGLLERNETAGDSFTDRSVGQLSEMLNALQIAPLGHGFGTEQTGGQYYATGIADFNHFESLLPRLVMETGILGLIGYVVIAGGAVLALQRAKLGASFEVRAVLLVTQLFLGVMFYSNVLFDHTASAFVWMIFTAVLSAKELQQTTTGKITKNRGKVFKTVGRKLKSGGGSTGRRISFAILRPRNVAD